ncbi:unnamed protein product [Angiostrongylus costaricensis]|uniref:B box-type domain-containing protein n=1 Tax=Angiostrongylus costaricensis TaxID=334426 RepID=A0A158PD77_ANGCS|nr:unnamed protein product [Angiostrongylus costaricensis]
MGDQNGRLESPLSCQELEKSTPYIFRSSTSSPLLNTEPLPLDDQSHCPYCHKNFRKPRVLDCLHSMCEDCIIAQLDGRRDAQIATDLVSRNPTDCELEVPKLKERPTPPGVIRCPICAQESHVGNDVRYVHSMLLDYVRLAENEEAVGERRCRACKSEQPAIAVCKQCQSDLCSNCLSAHGVMRMFEGHEVMTYLEMEQLGQRGEVRPVQCPTHSLPYKMLCATCETLCCKVCLEMEHLNHKSEIEKLADKVERKWRDSMAEWSAIPDRSASLHEQYESAKVHIEMLAQLEETRQKQEVAIEDLYRKMNLNEARVSDALRFSRNLLSKSNGMELLASRRKVVQQLNNLTHTMPALGIQVELEYQPLSKKQLDTHMNAICGNVIGDERFCSTSSTWGSGIAPSRISGPGGDTFGWPPSSHPPDLPSPSPPIPLKDIVPPAFPSNATGLIGQPSNTNSAVTTSGGNVCNCLSYLALFEIFSQCDVFGTSQQGSSMRELHCPSGFCLSASDDILIADTNNHRIVVCGPPHPWKIGRPGTDDGQLCFPRKVIALKADITRYAVLDKGVDGKTRCQLLHAHPLDTFYSLIPNFYYTCSDVDIPRVVFWFDASSHLGEASDVAIYEKNVYITDFKHHCVQVFNTDGQFIRKLGEPSQTPYPIGIDVSKNGDILVADTHGNHLHVVVFTADGTLQQSFTHNEFRLSRCVGLRVAGSGHVVTLCKHNHTLFVFKPLYIRVSTPSMHKISVLHLSGL